jgi:hypothetical protein
LKKCIGSLLLLGLFLYGMKASAFFPSLQMLKDTQLDFSIFPVLAVQKVGALLCLFPIGLGFFGWVQWIRNSLLTGLKGPMVALTAWAIALCFFSFYCFALGVNELLNKSFVGLFFVVGIIPGIFEFNAVWKLVRLKNREVSFWFPFGLVALIWCFEYLSPPIIWDAVLDHFRFAEEAARLHQIPFHWTNHTGDMPKFAETLLAGFWCLGGETLAKLMSGLSALLTAYLVWVIAKENDFSNKIGQWIFWTCPLFLAFFAWGYVEGFLAFYEVLALYCLWQFHKQPQMKRWVYLCAFFLGTSFSIKYTAVFAIVGCDVLLLYHNFKHKRWGARFWPVTVLLFLPMVPWVLRSELANGNPLYPLATQWFGGPPGYNIHMEANLLEDTGKSTGLSILVWFSLLWNNFFTINNQVGAAWTPLFLMSFPWWRRVFKDRFVVFLLVFTGIFLAGWLLFCTSLRHASGGVLVLVLIVAVVWDKALKEDDQWAKAVFGLGCLVSLWLCLSAQLSTTAPYASALGLEDPLKRLERNYGFNQDIFAAYRDIESQSGPWDKVVALGVFQTYPLQRTSFVDFYWKKPTLLSWAGDCQTAEELAMRFKKEGALFVLYPREEAIHSFVRNKNYQLEGMREMEYLRFWSYFTQPVAEYENTFLYRVTQMPSTEPMILHEVPGLQEPAFYPIQKADFKGDHPKAYQLAVDWTAKYPFIAEGWRQRAQVAGSINPEDAYLSALKANQLGLQDISLCQILSLGLISRNQPAKAKVWDNLGLYREMIETAKEVRALEFYRNGK